MMEHRVALLFVILAAGCFLAGCTKNDAALEVPVVTVMTHDSFSIGKEVLDGFEKEQGVRLRFLKSGDAGAALNQAILSKEHPLADVFYGVDNTFMSRALRANIFVPYSSPLLSCIDESLVLDKTHRLVPVDYGDVCVNYDRAWFSQEGLPVPESLDDLVRPEYSGLLVVENPATSSPGLAFLLATVGTCGEDGFVEFWQADPSGVVDRENIDAVLRRLPRGSHQLFEPARYLDFTEPQVVEPPVDESSSDEFERSSHGVDLLYVMLAERIDVIDPREWDGILQDREATGA